MIGSPDPPPPYTIEPAFPKLTFRQPVLFASIKGIDRLFVGELRGKVYSFPNDPGCSRADLAFDLAKSHPEIAGLYGLTFHPDFAKQRFVYMCYALKEGQADGTRVSRFEVSRTDPPTIVADSEKVLITWLAGGHNGGCLQFGPEGFLYISTGDAAAPAPPDPLHTGQDVSDLLSSILRIDVDRADPGKAYGIPPDNPFVALPGARPEIWAFGFRNPWKMSFDRETGQLWVGDVGWELWEMVYRIEKGANCGWSVMEGRQPIRPNGQRGPGPIVPPIVEHPHSEAASVTGGYVYRGSRLKELIGAYIYGDFQTGKVWGLRMNGGRVTWQRELANTPLQLVSFGEDNAGEIYALDYERTQQIYRFIPNPTVGSSGDFPRSLSRTGIFASTKDHIPAAGVLPYSINAERWADHAISERFLALPGRAQIDVDPSGRWKLPDGSVLAMTVSRDLEQGDPKSRKRIETQILHFEAEAWRPYTYVWNDEQTDAHLAGAEGATRTIAVRDPRAPSGQRAVSHRIHSRAECNLCHNPWVGNPSLTFGRQSASPLALSTRQLNCERDGDQLEHLSQLGVFAQPTAAKGSKPPKQVNPYDASADLSQRARSYLQVNCAHCHQFNAGGAAFIDLSESLELSRTGTVGVAPVQGTFGIDGARIIAPGDPLGSVLFYRMAKLGGGRMPRVGSNIVDERGLALIAAWIANLPSLQDGLQPGGIKGRLGAAEAAALHALEATDNTPNVRAEAIRTVLRSTRGALALIRMLDSSAISGETRREVIDVGKDDPRSEVRDLFERFVPDAERVKRLGEAIRPEEILALAGNAERGKRFFFADSATQCKSCHRIGNIGETLGPELDKVGAKYPKPALLQEILEPSRTIEPKYAAYLLETKSGQIYSGLLAEKSAREVVLKDAKNQAIRVPAGDVETLVPTPKSLMPDLLLRDMTAQQAADLLEYLSTLR